MFGKLPAKYLQVDATLAGEKLAFCCACFPENFQKFAKQLLCGLPTRDSFCASVDSTNFHSRISVLNLLEYAPSITPKSLLFLNNLNH